MQVSKPRVGFIGLGDQGEPMARAIVDAGFELSLWARRAESLVPFADTAALIAASPRALAEAVDILCFCTFGREDLEDLLFREGDGAAHGLCAGKILVIHNTVAPGVCREIAARLAPQGVAVLDAPVAGGRERAFAKRLAVMVGGDRQAFGRLRPVLESYGDPIVHLGAIGSGQTAKIINNALMICNMQLADAAFDIAEELGLARHATQDLLLHSSAASTAMGFVVAHDRGERKAHAAGLGILAKDIGLFHTL